MIPPMADIVPNRVKEKLARGEVVASMIVRLVRQIEIARIAKTAGFDSLYVDMEHCSASLGSAAEARAVVAAARFPPQGARSAAGALPHLGFRAFPVAETYAAVNAATTVVVQF
jgi:4-hydroxy-2-oxoheptanedioate aldolase